jgi:parvulin-like peptidyl-prolyl isomerase
MLDKIRQQSRSFIIYFFFGIIILSFVVTFGPASMRLSCGESTRAGSVAGRTITNADIRFALALAMPRSAPATFRALIFDMLLRREILAMEGERMGFSVGDQEIDDMITKRRQVYVLGMPRDLFDLGAWPRGDRDKDGKPMAAPHFYYDQFKRWVQNVLQMKVEDFRQQQRRELLALKVEETIKNGVLVSEREALARFEIDNHQLEIEFAKFNVDDFAKEILVDRSEIMKWLSQKDNRDKVDALYQKTKWKLTGLPHERRVRHLMVKLAPTAGEPEKKAARDKVDRLRIEIEANRANLMFSAQLVSEDEGSKKMGGDLGWKEKDKLGFGAAFAEEVFKLPVLTLSPVLASDQGLHLVYVEGERKGDVAMKEAQPYLAEEVISQERATAATRKVAEEALTRLMRGKKMDEVFPGKEEAEAPPEDTADATAAAAKKPVLQKFHPLLPTYEKATVQRTETTIGQIGKVPDLLTKVWQLSDQDPVLGEVVTVPGTGTSLGYLVVIRLKSKTVPDPKEFEKQKDTLLTELADVKKDDSVKRWVYARCEALQADGKIKFEKQYAEIVYYQGEGEQKKEQREHYQPCKRLEKFGQPSSVQ